MTIEPFAAWAHQVWGAWSRQLFEECATEPRRHDGRVIIPALLVDRMQRQATTPYTDLQEPERAKFRILARELLSIVDNEVRTLGCERDRLWEILDEVESTTDIIANADNAYRQLVHDTVQKRFKVLLSDGDRLYRPSEPSPAARLTTLQLEQVAWVEHNFGKRGAHQPLQGLVEELGELDEALRRNDAEEIADSLADAMIYSADLCSAHGWDLGEVWVNKRPSDTYSLLVWVGKLNHYLLKHEQGIRGARLEDAQHALRVIVWILDTIARGHDIDLVAVTWETWCKVRERDWKKHPGTGLPPSQPFTINEPPEHAGEDLREVRSH
jgi:NTP pyrophosphatase (non-canonical NTP hydrolase)